MSEIGVANISTGVVVGLCLPLILWLHRKDDIVAIRVPSVIMTEISVNALKLIIFGILDESSEIPCALHNALESAFKLLVFCVTMGRLALFYRIVQVNIMEVYQETMMDKLIHAVGLFCSPREFLRQEMKLRFLKKQQSSTLSLNSASDLSSLHIDSTAHDTLAVKEYFMWLGKLLLWSLIWALIVLGVTVGGHGNDALVASEEANHECEFLSSRLNSAQVFFFEVFHIVIVANCYRWVSDSLGLKTEIIYIQSAIALIWLIDAFLHVLDTNHHDTAGTWLDYSITLLHMLVTFGFPISLLYYRKYLDVKLKSAKIKKLEDFEKLWQDPSARAKIMIIARRRFALENVLFLAETDALHAISDKQANHLIKKYLVPEAPFELNVPETILRAEKQSKEDLLKASRQHDLLKASRHHIMNMVFENFKEDLLVEINQLPERTAEV